MTRHTLMLALFSVGLSCTAQAAELAGGRIPLPQRTSAAETTANEAAACKAAQPFYWEIGNAERALSSGQAGSQAPDARTTLALASASKWIYGAYVTQVRQGRLSDEDVRFLSFRSGYTRFRVCLPNQTVAECQAGLINGRGRIDRDTEGYFDYNGGHMQKHATLMGLGDLDKDQLARAIERGLRDIGPAWNIGYSQAQLAGGVTGTAAQYARFLRAMLKGDLQLGAQLGSHAVCANPQTCPGEAVKTPIPTKETWHYSLGHWVEDDPHVGDGAFSSPGAFGFYPWIDAGKTVYGILAREDRSRMRSADPDEKPAVESVDCGRLIRKAWMSGQAQP
jgi:hypothetical protein